MDGPERKRARIDSISDPLIPIKDSSPFHDASDDVINHIFRRFGDIKAKMRLQLVCDKFRSRLLEKAPWQNDNRLKICFSNERFLINDSQLNSIQGGHKPLAALLERITVQHVIIDKLPDGFAFITNICAQIIFQKASFALQSVKLIGDGDAFTAQLINSLGACDLTNVKKIELIFNKKSTYREYEFDSAFWPFVLRCTGLKTLSLMSVYDQNILRNLAVLKNCRALEYVKFDTLNDSDIQFIEDELPEILSDLCNSLNHLKAIYPFSLRDIDLNSFVEGLTEDTRSRMESFGYHFTLVTSTNRNFVKTVTGLFPKLKQLDITVENDKIWDSETVVKTVENIIDNFGICTKPYVFKLNLQAQDSRKIFTRLCKGKGAKIITDETGIYKCIKNNLQIELNLD